METFQLEFDTKILEYEKQNRWGSAADYAFQLWLDNPKNLNRLLCAGTQLWYTLLVLDDIKKDSLSLEESELISETYLKKRLMKVTWFGFDHFPDDTVFNAYFGYMISLMPHFFCDYSGDYLGWQEKGNKMIRLSYIKNSDNLFAEALCFELDDYVIGSPFYNTCKKIWTQITPEQWGCSEVQRYFFHILYGNLLCDRAGREM